MKIGNILKDGTIERDATDQGLVYKDYDAFKNKTGVCYVPELYDIKYTYDDIVRECNGDKNAAKVVFDMLDWQKPNSLYLELLSNGEFKRGAIYVKNVYAFDIYDRRTGDQIDERTVDEAIKNHIKGIDDNVLATYDENAKFDLLRESGYQVRPLDFIETCRHQSGHAGQKLNPLEEHVQVDFNFPDETVTFDLHMEQDGDKKYLFLEFFPKDGCMNLMFDTEGNEKVYEMCPHCGEEVVLNAIEKAAQKCPNCGNYTKACCLCGEDKDCKNCGD